MKAHMKAHMKQLGLQTWTRLVRNAKPSDSRSVNAAVSGGVSGLRLGWLAPNVTLQSEDVQPSPVSVGFGLCLD